jgi:hypothetical protein
MKFGCLFYADSENIGDDIQTYAQRRFLPRVDYWIDRESLHIFYPDEAYKVALIMNAWFMYTPQNWPPSPYIYPLFISTHFSKYHIQWIKSKEEKYSLAQRYLQENGPVGCRDASTLQMLQKIGIGAYFSGCLTLTLQPFPDVKKQDYICLVDVPPEAVEYVKKKGYKVRIMSHDNSALKKMSPQERLEQAESYLKVYQGARCVLTSRLHCALPCTGLGTPVLVLYAPEYDERFSSLKRFLHTTDIESFLGGSWDVFLEAPYCCSGDYLPYANRLIKTCEDFVNRVSQETKKASVGYRSYWEAAVFQGTIRKETYIAENNRLYERIEETKAVNEDLQKINHDIQRMNDNLQNSVRELQLYNTNQAKAIGELETMNGELRQYSLDQERVNTELNAQATELKTMNEELRQCGLDQEHTNIELNAQVIELKTMNEELRQYSLDQEHMNTELNAQATELKTMNEELRQYGLDQEHMNIELNAQVAELKKQLSNLSNLSEKERRLIQFLRKRRKQY